MTGTDVIRKQLEAARASVDAALALLPGGEPPQTVTGPCPHPPGKRKAAPVGGDPDQFHCTECHTFVSGKVVTDGA